MQITKEVNPHPRIHYVSMCGVSSFSFSFSYVTCWMLVHAYGTSYGKAKWSGPHHTIKLLHLVLFHSVTCYIDSTISCIHVNTTKLRSIMCTLVVTCVILRSLRCTRLSPCCPSLLHPCIYTTSWTSSAPYTHVTVCPSYVCLLIMCSCPCL